MVERTALSGMQHPSTEHLDFMPVVMPQTKHWLLLVTMPFPSPKMALDMSTFPVAVDISKLGSQLQLVFACNKG
jgi:hypothetical protein